MSHIDDKRIFLVATGSDKLNNTLESILNSHFKNLSIYKASDGSDALFKIDNVIPHVVIISNQISKISVFSVVEGLLNKKNKVAILILSSVEDKEHFMDEVVTGQVQYLTNATNSSLFTQHIVRSLNWLAFGEDTLYRLKFLAENQILLKEGEEGKFVYIVRSGRLKARVLLQGSSAVEAASKENQNSQQIHENILGYIEPGEFVGEMAYINGEPRNADVVSLTDCELVEIPSGSLDSILFSKPSWSKALMKTLSKRLKDSNQKSTNSQ